MSDRIASLFLLHLYFLICLQWRQTSQFSEDVTNKFPLTFNYGQLRREKRERKKRKRKEGKKKGKDREGEKERKRGGWKETWGGRNERDEE